MLQMRHNLLDSIHPAAGLTSGAIVPVQQCRQREQIRHAERRAARRQPNERIHRRNVGKRLRNGAQRPLFTRLVDQPLSQGGRNLDQFEFTSAKRMKRVRHPNAPFLHALMRCS